MATDFQFSKHVIDDHYEKVGVDVRPSIEIRMELMRMQDFYRQVLEKHSNLFESLVMSPTEWRIQKKFTFPGKGEIELPTFVLTPRGIAFTIPRRVAELQSEYDLPDSDKQLIQVLEIFRAVFPQCQFYKVGKVQEYFFDCSPHNSMALVAKRFTRVISPTELLIRFNLARDGYNRIFTIQPAVKQRKEAGGLKEIGQGVRVSADFNNVDMSRALRSEDIRKIMYDADAFHDNEVFGVLNGQWEKGL